MSPTSGEEDLSKGEVTSLAYSKIGDKGPFYNLRGREWDKNLKRWVTSFLDYPHQNYHLDHICSISRGSGPAFSEVGNV